ncbi:DUF3632 domain-containing protein [Aspergillus mulundensis]|uniref:Uncharacterized protein n=1 Tax=Aspergillus mulundensis TaxID=1810919 RepID=A0A3D8R9F5_9EURO|nr:Uncharacterized protein DSM5745_08188 [Aspergillus mulundensis]RDW70677.1 Uncharacterized protein DSM5745_08188 [Aspergillus mulundensis]
MSLKLNIDAYLEVPETAKEETIEPPKQKGALALLRELFTKPKPKPTKPPGDNHARTSPYSQEAVFAVLNDFLQPESTKPLHQAVREILALLPENAPESTEIWSAGDIIIEVASQIPYSHPSQLKLAQLVEQLISAEKFLDKSPSGDGMRYRGQRFKESLRDSVTGPNDELLNEWPNLNAFYAHLDACHIIPYTPAWAISAMWSAFEAEIEDPFPGEKDQCILAAAQYIFWSGQELFKAISYVSEDYTPGEPGPLYTGEGGLSLHRWRFWKDGFRAAGGDMGIGEEARGVAGKAAVLMEGLESALVFDL